ncbi:MAG: ShlB/FhaC/HecB family hemolysin secretion/activation protein [Tepidisphaeraceae bacterium]
MPILGWSGTGGAAEVPTTRPAAPVAAARDGKPDGIGIMDFKSAAATAAQADGPALHINKFEIDYLIKREGGPKIEDFMQVPLELGKTPSGLVKLRPGLEKVTLTLAAPGTAGSEQYRISALQSIAEQLVAAGPKLGWVGIYVGIDARQLDMATLEADPEGVVKKWDANVPLKYLVMVGAVSEVRTVAAGTPVPVGERINNPIYNRIKEMSPIQPVPGKNLLKKDVLDEYIDRLNRYPWRRVDVSLDAGEHDGDMVMDYLVAQAKAWTAYFQLSNTGTEQTTKWRERVGFVHNNLTGRTDILALDYVTGNFHEANAVLASYETPIYGDRLRGKVFASWSQYKASDVGQVAQKFDGEETAVGAELIANLVQEREWFLDGVAGLRFKNTKTNNTTSDSQGEADFWVPYLGLRVERNGETSSTSAHATMEFGFMTDATTTNSGNSIDSARGLGRDPANDQWQALQADITHSFYLEPLFAPHGTSALAHEIVLSGKMQWTLGERLVPQEEMVAGGIYTVRGYPESIVAGDTVFVGTVEYRMHVPRMLGVQAASSKVFGNDFYWLPHKTQAARPARPDWDLVFKGFLDAGRVINNDKQAAYEEDNTLLSCGVGMDLLFKQNMSLRVDYGVVLHDIQMSPTVEGPNVGESRLHVVFTIMY